MTAAFSQTPAKHKGRCRLAAAPTAAVHTAAPPSLASAKISLLQTIKLRDLDSNLSRMEAFPQGQCLVTADSSKQIYVDEEGGRLLLVAPGAYLLLARGDLRGWTDSPFTFRVVVDGDPRFSTGADVVLRTRPKEYCKDEQGWAFSVWGSVTVGVGPPVPVEIWAGSLSQSRYLSPVTLMAMDLMAVRLG
jgi:hypothetical protein